MVSGCEQVTAALGTTPLMLAVIVGALQNIFSKGAKYSLFDPCKEMGTSTRPPAPTPVSSPPAPLCITPRV